MANYIITYTQTMTKNMWRSCFILPMAIYLLYIFVFQILLCQESFHQWTVYPSGVEHLLWLASVCSGHSLPLHFDGFIYLWADPKVRLYAVQEIRIRNWSAVFKHLIFYRLLITVPLKINVQEIWLVKILTKIDFGRPNAEIECKMANGWLLHYLWHW